MVAAVTGEPPGAGDLRLVLSGAYALRAMLGSRRAPPISTLRTKARKAWELTHAGRYTAYPAYPPSPLAWEPPPGIEPGTYALRGGRGASTAVR